MPAVSGVDALYRASISYLSRFFLYQHPPPPCLTRTAGLRRQVAVAYVRSSPLLCSQPRTAARTRRSPFAAAAVGRPFSPSKSEILLAARRQHCVPADSLAAFLRESVSNERVGGAGGERVSRSLADVAVTRRLRRSVPTPTSRTIRVARCGRRRCRCAFRGRCRSAAAVGRRH